MTMRYAHLAPVAFENAIETQENHKLSKEPSMSEDVIDLELEKAIRKVK